MLSKTLLKLIDEAILPAVVVIAGKILGIALLTNKLGAAFTLNINTLQDPTASIVNTYSNLFAFGGITLGLIVIMSRAYFFHTTHVHPKITLRLYELNISQVIETTYELFHQAVVWLSYQWLLTFLFLLQSYWNLTNSGFALACLLVTVIFSSLFVIDVDKELHLAKNNE